MGILAVILYTASVLVPSTTVSVTGTPVFDRGTKRAAECIGQTLVPSRRAQWLP